MADQPALWQIMFRIVDGIRAKHLRNNGDHPGNPILNLTISQGRMLQQVIELREGHPEGISLRMLADRTGVTPAAASEMVDVLVRKNALIREVSPLDRRAVRIRLSSLVRKRIDRAGEFTEAVWSELIAGFTPEELKLFRLLLGRIQERLSHVETTPKEPLL